MFDTRENPPAQRHCHRHSHTVSYRLTGKKNFRSASSSRVRLNKMETIYTCRIRYVPLRYLRKETRANTGSEMGKHAFFT